jgi:hypothetical protein
MSITDLDSEYGQWSLSVLTPHFQTALTSKRMIRKSPSWSHSLLLIELFSDLANLLNFHSQGAAQPQFKSVAFFVLWVVPCSSNLKSKNDVFLNHINF